MKIITQNLMPVSFSDFGEFTDSETNGLSLVDITGDARFFNSETMFQGPGSYVYQLDLTLNAERVKEMGIEGLLLEVFSNDPSYVFHPDPDKPVTSYIDKQSAITRALLVNADAELKYSAEVDILTDLRSAAKEALLEGGTSQSATNVMDILAAEEPRNLDGEEVASAIFHHIFDDGIDLGDTDLADELLRAYSTGQDPLSNFDEYLGLEPGAMSKFSKANTSFDTGEPNVITISGDNVLAKTSLMTERWRLLQKPPTTQANQPFKEILALASESKRKRQNKVVKLAHLVSVYNENFRVLRNIEIPKNILQLTDSFFVRIIPVLSKLAQNKTNRIPSSTAFRVFHDSQVQEILLPIVPPQLSVVQQEKGEIRLKIKNPDPYATSAKICRRVHDPRLEHPVDQTEFSVDLTIGSHEYFFDDSGVDNCEPNVIIYDAIIEHNGEAGPSNTILVHGLPNPNMPVSVEQNTLTMIAHNNADGVKLLIDNIPNSVTAIRIGRENLSQVGDYTERTTFLDKGNGKSYMDVRGNRSLHFTDRSVTENSSYRYFCVLRPKFGSDYLSEDDEVIRRRYPRKPLPVDVKAENLQSRILENGEHVISIDLVATTRDDGMDFLLELLKQAKIDTFFLDEINKQRGAFKDIVGFLVERVDKKTGKRVSFGIQSPGTFIDSAAMNSSKNIPPVEPGKKYTYFVKVCINPAESFFKNLFAKYMSDKDTSGVQAKAFNAKKFYDPIAKSFGILPSDLEVRSDTSPGEILAKGETGLTFALDLKTTAVFPHPTDLEFHPTPSEKQAKSGKLRWKIKGPVELALKCLVYCEYGRTEKKLIGTVPVTKSTDSYYFVDHQFASEVGTKVYSVKLMWINFKLSSATNEVKAHKPFSCPESLTKMGGRSKFRGTKLR